MPTPENAAAVAPPLLVRGAHALLQRVVAPDLERPREVGAVGRPDLLDSSAAGSPIGLAPLGDGALAEPIEIGAISGHTCFPARKDGAMIAASPTGGPLPER